MNNNAINNMKEEKNKPNYKIFFKKRVERFVYVIKRISVKICDYIKIFWQKIFSVFLKHKKAGILSTCVVISIFLMQSVHYYHGPHQEKNLENSTNQNTAAIVPPRNPMLSQLNDMSDQLASIKHQLSGKKAYVNLDQIKSMIVSLQEKTEQLTLKSNQLISKQIKEGLDPMTEQLKGMRKALAVVAAKKAHHKMLKPSNLPFKVISVDNIQETEVVTVSYAHRILPVDVGDSIAGWTLVSASQIDQRAQFKNQNDDYVPINLNGYSQDSKEN